MSEKLPQGIDKLPSGKYRARVRGYGSVTRTRLRDAEKWLNEARIAKENGEPPRPKAITLGELAREYMTAEKSRLSDNFYESRRNLWAAHLDQRVRPASAVKRGKQPDRNWRHPIVDMKLPAITPRVIEDWRDERLAATAAAHPEGKPSADAIAMLMSFMSTVFKRGVNHRYIYFNPMREVRKPKPARKPGSTAKRVMPISVERIRSHMEEQQDRLMVSVLAYSGIRPGEARGLKFSDVGRTLWIERAIAGQTEKGTKTEHERPVRLVDPLRDEIKAWQRERAAADGDWVFVRTDGKPWRDTDWRNWKDRVFRPAVEAAGVDIGRPYHLRSSAGSLWIHEGKDPLQVAEWMGDNPATVYKHYARQIREFREEDRIDAADLIMQARRDTLMTRKRVQAGASASKGNPRKPRVLAESE